MRDRGPPTPIWPPVPGTYRTKLVKGGPWVPARIWFGNAIVDGEEQDRAPGWYCEIDGRSDRWERDDATGYRCKVPLSIDRLWPFCADKAISQATYDYMRAHGDWAKADAPFHPSASPHVAVDLSQIPPIW